MANWCNNYLHLHTRVKPVWIDAELVGDDALELPGDVYAFGSEIECKVLGDMFDISMHFQTKWAPPIEFYEALRNDTNTAYLYADYEESGSEIYGSFDLDGHNECKHPPSFYSEILDQHIMLEEPPPLYLSVVRDEHVLFPEYIQDIMHRTCSNDAINKELEAELQACATELGVNLEDQQWQELIS